MDIRPLLTIGSNVAIFKLFDFDQFMTYCDAITLMLMSSCTSVAYGHALKQMPTFYKYIVQVCATVLLFYQFYIHYISGRWDPNYIIHKKVYDMMNYFLLTFFMMHYNDPNVWDKYYMIVLTWSSLNYAIFRAQQPICTYSFLEKRNPKLLNFL
jgi:hypothetical protein